MLLRLKLDRVSFVGGKILPSIHSAGVGGGALCVSECFGPSGSPELDKLKKIPDPPIPDHP